MRGGALSVSERAVARIGSFVCLFVCDSIGMEFLVVIVGWPLSGF